MARIKRVYFVRCRGEECISLSEFLLENMAGFVDVTMRVVDDGVLIEIYGYKSEVRDAWTKIKKLLSMYSEQFPAGRKGRYRYSLEAVVRRVRHTFPPQLLAEIAARMGRFLAAQEGYLETDMSPEELYGLASRIAEAMEEVRYEVRGRTTKYYVVAASILSSKPIPDVIDESMELGILGEDEDTGKPVLRYEWRQALDKYLSIQGARNALNQRDSNNSG